MAFRIKNIDTVEVSHDICFVVCSPARIKLVTTILAHQKNGLTVTELSKILKQSLSRVSHQLAILKKYHLIRAQKRGREKVYKIQESNLKKRLPCLYVRL